jgi:hypothetical protein
MSRPDRARIRLGPSRFSSPRAIRQKIEEESRSSAQAILQYRDEVPVSVESRIELATVTEYTDPGGVADLFFDGRSVEFLNSTPYVLYPGLDIVVWPTEQNQYVCVGILNPAETTLNQAPIVVGNDRRISFAASRIFPLPRSLSTIDTADLFGLGSPAIFARTRSASDLGVWVPLEPELYTLTGLPGDVFFYALGVVVTLQYNKTSPQNSTWYVYEPVNGLSGPFLWDASLTTTGTPSLTFLGARDGFYQWATLRSSVADAKLFRFDSTNGWEDTGMLGAPSAAVSIHDRGFDLSERRSETITVRGSGYSDTSGWLYLEEDTGLLFPETSDYYGNVQRFTKTIYLKDPSDLSSFVSYSWQSLPLYDIKPFPSFASDYPYPYPIPESPLSGTCSYIDPSGTTLYSLSLPPLGAEQHPVMFVWDAPTDTTSILDLRSIGIPIDFFRTGSQVLRRRTGTVLFTDDMAGNPPRKAMSVSPHTGLIYFCALGKPSDVVFGLLNDPQNPTGRILAVYAWDMVNPASLVFYDDSVVYVGGPPNFGPIWFDGTNINITATRNGAQAFDYGSSVERDTEYFSSLFFSVPE